MLQQSLKTGQHHCGPNCNAVHNHYQPITTHNLYNQDLIILIAQGEKNEDVYPCVRGTASLSCCH